MKAPGDTTQKKQTLEDCLVKAVANGFTESFRVTDKGLTTTNGRNTYSEDNAVILETCRFDTSENPRNNSVVYMIETSDGKKGVLIDSYGSYTNERLVNFVKGLKTNVSASGERQALGSFYSRMIAKLKMTFS